MRHYKELLQALIPESQRKAPERGLSFNKLSCCSTPKQLPINPTWREDTEGLLGTRGSPVAQPDWASSTKPPWKARMMEMHHHHLTPCSAPGSLALGTELHVSPDFEKQGPSCPSKHWAPHLLFLMSSKPLQACMYSKLQGIPASGIQSCRTKMQSFMYYYSSSYSVLQPVLCLPHGLIG